MMFISRKEFHNSNLKINGEIIERVRKFKYLGDTLNEKWDCDEEVRTRKNMLLQRSSTAS